MLFAELQKLNKGDKKYAVIVFDMKQGTFKTIKFGARGYEDYTIHKNDKRRELYDRRHSVTQDWSNPLTAGFWSKWILWNKKTIAESIKDIENRFNIYINLV